MNREWTKGTELAGGSEMMDGMESTAVAAMRASQMDTMQWEGNIDNETFDLTGDNKFKRHFEIESRDRYLFTPHLFTT